MSNEQSGERRQYDQAGITSGQRLKCDYTLMEAIGFLIIWLILSVITLGIGMFFAIYYFYKTIINKTYIVDRSGYEIGRLDCDLSLGEVIGHIVIWILITLVTLGIGIIFYAFATFRITLNRTRIIATWKQFATPPHHCERLNKPRGNPDPLLPPPCGEGRGGGANKS